jgi:hypothetical protein
MVELQLTLPEEQLPAILAILERFSFVKIEQKEGRRRSKKEFLDDFEGSLKQAKLHLEGKIQLKNIQTILDEL